MTRPTRCSLARRPASSTFEIIQHKLFSREAGWSWLGLTGSGSTRPIFPRSVSRLPWLCVLSTSVAQFQRRLFVGMPLDENVLSAVDVSLPFCVAFLSLSFRLFIFLSFKHAYAGEAHKHRAMRRADSAISYRFALQGVQSAGNCASKDDAFWGSAGGPPLLLFCPAMVITS
jgi:hypothetical protein